MKRAIACLAGALVASAVWAGDGRIMGEDEAVHLQVALDCLNMTDEDMGFAKDHGEPRLVLERTRKILNKPLHLPKISDRILSTARKGDVTRLWKLAADLLELDLDPTGVKFKSKDLKTESEGETDLAKALADFIREVEKADEQLKKAFGDLSLDDQRYIAASLLCGTFNAEDRETVREDLARAGLTAELIQEVIREGNELDPEPAAKRYLDILERIDLASLVAAGEILHRATIQLHGAAPGVKDWPKKKAEIATRFGAVRIGTSEADDYAGRALLVLDPGGDDTYRGHAGSANGLEDARVSVIIDLGGDDRYEGEKVLAPGAALLGVSVLLDDGGDDVYRAEYCGQAAGLFGVAWMEDTEGKDTYEAMALAQGAAQVGVGILRDLDGRDTYEVGLYGQAFAGVRGLGLLIDYAGPDRYLAGGREPDHERHQDRFLSLSQGFAIGMRPFAGGGVAALVDLGGNDSYQADIYGQGVSYWYSIGMLLDASGNDTYNMYHYGQGSGIHLSSGLLYDGEGNDLYTGYILAQGNAHDYAVGMLFDGKGDDTYTADHHSQGRALNNALGVLIDSAGNDAYFGRQNDQCQGIGNDGGTREYGSLALLLDLGGSDRYSCGAADGARLLRPSYGIVYDVKED